jgi:hypothetical protein
LGVQWQCHLVREGEMLAPGKGTLLLGAGKKRNQIY